MKIELGRAEKTVGISFHSKIEMPLWEHGIRDMKIFISNLYYYSLKERREIFMDLSVIISLVGCLIALVLLMVLIMRNVHIMIVALISVVVVALTGGLNLYNAIIDTYMGGFVGYMKSYFMLFLVGALFGQVMDKSGAALGIAKLFVDKLGAKYAVLAIVLACAALVYGGISCFVIVFAVLPFAETLFKEADLPRRYLPGVMAFGTITFAMTGAGTPQVQNIVPIESLGTEASAGWGVSIIVMIFMFIIGMIYLTKAIGRAKASGQHYVFGGDEVGTDTSIKTPKGGLALIPLIVSVVCLNLLKIPVEISILIGTVLAYVMFSKFLSFKHAPMLFKDGFSSALSAIANTCVVVGFGGVVKAVPAFTWLTENISNIPGSPLIGVALAVTIIAGITGSASGGLGIAMPAIAPIYLAQGVVPQAIHRVASIASGALDSMPWNGYVVTLLSVIGINHKEGYFPVFVVSVVIPSLATALAIILFTVAPGLPM